LRSSQPGQQDEFRSGRAVHEDKFVPGGNAHPPSQTGFRGRERHSTLRASRSPTVSYRLLCNWAGTDRAVMSVTVGVSPDEKDHPHHDRLVGEKARTAGMTAAHGATVRSAPKQPRRGTAGTQPSGPVPQPPPKPPADDTDPRPVAAATSRHRAVPSAPRRR